MHAAAVTAARFKVRSHCVNARSENAPLVLQSS